MSLTFSYKSGCLSLSLSVQRICCTSLTFSHGCWLSLTLSLVLWSCLQSLTISHGCRLSFTVSSSSKELLAVSYCLFKFKGVTASLSLSPIVVSCLSLFFLAPWNCQLSLTVSYGCWLSLTVPLVPWSC